MTTETKQVTVAFTDSQHTLQMTKTTSTHEAESSSLTKFGRSIAVLTTASLPILLGRGIDSLQNTALAQYTLTAIPTLTPYVSLVSSYIQPVSLALSGLYLAWKFTSYMLFKPTYVTDVCYQAALKEQLRDEAEAANNKPQYFYSLLTTPTNKKYE